MKISEFQKWTDGQGAISPLVEDEVITGLTGEIEKSDRKIHTFIFPSGRVIEVFCDEEDTIVRVRSDEDIGLVM